MSIQADRLADDRGLSAEARLPEFVGEDHRSLEAEVFGFSFGESPAEHRLLVDQIEEARRNRAASNPVPAFVNRGFDVEVTKHEAFDPLERCGRVDFAELRPREILFFEVERFRGLHGVEGNHARGMAAEVDGADQKDVRDREDRDRGANANGQRSDGQGGQHGARL